MTTRRILLASTFLISGTTAVLAQTPAASTSSAVWKDVDERTMVASRPATVAAGGSTAPKREIVPLSYRTVQLNRTAMQDLLKQAPPEFSVPDSVHMLEIDVPLPYGKFARFKVKESPVMEAGLAKKYPEIKTYVGQGIDDPSASMRLDVTPRGFHAMVLSAQGQYFIDPYWTDDDTTYISYYKRNFMSPVKDRAWECGTRGSDFDPAQVVERLPSATRPTGASLRVYRLALGATAEYTAAVSGTNPGTVSQALSAMVTSINRCSAVYERDLAIRFVLVNNTDKLVYTDSATDGYTNNSGSTMLGENQTKIDSIIGNANYDIGHVFSTGGGGIAGLGVVCTTNQKARGVTGLGNPTGDPYDIDYVVHEMGHQFGANHPFNGTAANCAGGNRNASTAYEPGSGTTIMAYAGICAPQDLGPHSDDYFHTISYDEIDAYTSTGSGSTCPTTIATGNNPPAITALTNFTIPSQTPFVLTVSASDINGDTLSYCWEEFDKGGAQDPTSAPRDNGASPIFRSYDPSPSPTRLFPSLTYILNNQNVPPSIVSTYATGEFLPTTTRTMTFRVTVRDNRLNGGGSNYASMTVGSVSTAGPFAITGTLNASGTIAGGSTQPVTWNVANSNVAPINCANVKISLSTDGGNTFPIVLAPSVPNTGSASVAIPNTANVATTQGRIKVEAVGNIFFDISDANLTITSTNTAPSLTITGAVTVARGTPTATVAVVGNATDAEGNAVSVSVSNLPGDVSVTPSIAAGSISLSVLANCTIVTTNTNRTYPITLTATDSNGSTTSASVNLIITPNPSPTIGTYNNVSLSNTGATANVTPSAAPADANNNLMVNPVSVLPSVLPGGGTITVNANTGVVTVTSTASSTLAVTPVRVTVVDSCGAATVRVFNVTVVSPTPVLSAGVATAPSTESCLPPNGAVDPGETVTLSLPISNAGGTGTTNLVATLQSSGGVTPVGNPAQTFGVVAPNAAVSQSFQFVASGTCGGTITATLQLQDGATNYGTVTYVIRLGAPASNTTLFENFDSITPPALPAGWTSLVVAGSVSDWTTSATSPDSAPNAISATPSAAGGESRLDTASVVIPSATSQLRFRHRYNTESGFDGGVLEISIAGGAFTDIITAGGSFVSGGYTGVLNQDTGFLNLRNAWTGNSSTYITTLINLPASVAAQSVRFRYRLACDSSVSPGTGIWRIDTIEIIDNSFACTSCNVAPVFTSSLPASPVTAGTPYTHTFTATGSPAPTFSVTGGTLPPGLTLMTGGVLSGTPTSAGNGSFPNLTVTAANGVAPAATQNFSLNAVTLSTNYIASFGLTGSNAVLTADPRGNGLANLLEYALGLNPNSTSLVGIPVAQIKFYAGVPYVYITFPRSSVASDLTYSVEASADLQTWTTIASSSGGAVTSGAGFVGETGAAPTFTVEVRDTQPVDPITGAKRFLRLRVTTP